MSTHAFLRSRLPIGWMVVIAISIVGCGQSSPRDAGSSPSATAVADDEWLIAAAMQETPPTQWRTKLENLSDEQLRSPGLAWAIASLHEGEGDFEASARWSRIAFDLEPGLSTRSVQVVVRRGLAAGEYQGTVGWLDELQHSHPTATEIRRLRYGLHLKLYRLDEARVILHELIRSREFDAFTLEALVVPKYNLPPDKTVQELIESALPTEAMIGPAMYFLDQHQYEDAIAIFEKVLRIDPNHAQAYAGYALALVNDGQREQYRSVLQSLTDDQVNGLSKHGHFWSSLASFCDPTAAAIVEDWMVQAETYFAWRAAQLTPDSRPCLATLVSALNRRSADQADSPAPRISDEASARDRWMAMRQTSAKRLEIVSRLYEAWEQSREVQHQQPVPCLAIAESLLQLDRVLEAEGWSAIAFRLAGRDNDSALIQRIARFRREVAVALVRPTRNETAASLSLSDFDRQLSFDADDVISKLLKHQHVNPIDRQAGDTATSFEFRLTDVADRWGLRHLGSDGSSFRGPLVPLIYQFGCGGGVIDFDLDGWQDLYLTSAGNDARSDDQPANALYRNLGGRMRLEPMIGETRPHAFSQGVAVGDYNEDGFPDLWVLNLGSNQLLENQGDGTFQRRDVSASGTKRWSTSGAIADLDGDGLSDLVAVNYVEEDENLYRNCVKEGSATLCPIAQFQPAANEIYFGRSDGDFDPFFDPDVPLDVGRSLGVLVGRFVDDASHIFVSNDLTPNELIKVSKPASNADDTRGVRAIGVLSGLAFADGAATQASMGIAKGDWDNDQQLDFYVTGFSDEPDAFYHQVRDEVWIDEIKRSDVSTHSRTRVGFGCVAVDLDGDGIEELAVTNGHISDLEDVDGVPFKQPFDVFRWSATKQSFIQASDRIADADQKDGYHATDHIGRAIFAMDIDRDLDPDLCITHLNENVALLENKRSNPSRFVAIRLVGQIASREAIGAHITYDVTSASGRIRRKLFRTAGEGFMASGEPILRIGVGEADEISNVKIDWPSGVAQFVGPLRPGRLHLVVEGQQPWVLDSMDDM